MPRLDGRVFIVTGATSGMGRAAAELFSAEGARLVLNGRDEAKGGEVLDSTRPTARGAKRLFTSLIRFHLSAVSLLQWRFAETRRSKSPNPTS